VSDNKRKKVFISHAGQDRSHATKICDLLEKNQVNCWIAPRDIAPGSNYGEAINAGIDSVPALALVYTKNASKSARVRNEIEYAVSRKKKIFPFRIQAVPPAKATGFFDKLPQWIDVTESSLETGVDQLVAGVREMEEQRIGSTEPDTPSDVRNDKITLKYGRNFLHILAKEKIHFGKNKNNDITTRIMDESGFASKKMNSLISRFHCQIQLQGNECLLVDIGFNPDENTRKPSAYGVFLNRKKVLAGASVSLPKDENFTMSFGMGQWQDLFMER